MNVSIILAEKEIICVCDLYSYELYASIYEECYLIVYSVNDNISLIVGFS